MVVFLEEMVVLHYGMVFSQVILRNEGFSNQKKRCLLSFPQKTWLDPFSFFP
jgi:hypothetical protein